MKPRFSGVLVFLCVLLAGGLRSVRAQVDASLVSADETIAAGQPFTVALHFVHRPGWHTYWLNPGTGLTTSIAWKLPPGWKAGGIEWPAPHLIRDREGNVTGNGYDGDLLLPVEITPPANAAAGSYRLHADIDWLMCQNVCEPGSAHLQLTVVAVAAVAARPDAAWGPKIREVLNRLPRTDPDWDVTAKRAGNTVTLLVHPRGAASVAPAPGGLHFFSDDNLVGYDLPQRVSRDGSGGYTLLLPVSPDGPQDAAVLHGVLTAEGGWAANEPALRIDARLGGPAAATASAGEIPVASAGGLGATLLLALAGGLILNLMPCVFPVLGIKILGFVNQAGTDRRKVAAHGLAFTAGVLLSFWLLAGVLAVLRRGGAQLGWGFQLQSPIFIYCLAGAMLVFALNLSGVFEFGLSATAIGGTFQSRTGYTGSFFTGVLATLVATPCSAPLLAPALGAALTLSPLDSWAVFTCIGVGLSIPYLLLSIFPGAVRMLPRPGAWMETFRQLIAFPLYGTVGYLVWVLAGQVSDAEFLNALLGLVVVAFAIWIYGRFHAPGASPGRALFGLVGCLVLLLLGGWTGWPLPPKSDDIVWEKWSPEEVAKLHAAGRIVYVDFTARWCATCQANKKIVFHSKDVLRDFRARHVATLRGDWTNRDPAITAELEKYHRSAVPFNQVWLPAQEAPVLLPELLTPKVVLNAVDRNS